MKAINKIILTISLVSLCLISTSRTQIRIFNEEFPCAEGEELNGMLCYPKCRSGFTGVGPVCWQNCPSGFRNDGVFCAKPKPYGRGAGHITRKKCEKKHDGCKKYGLLWYPECKENYHNVGCCICSPNCPNNMVDIGVSCTKQTYGRGVGRV